MGKRGRDGKGREGRLEGERKKKAAGAYLGGRVGLLLLPSPFGGERKIVLIFNVIIFMVNLEHF